MRLAPYSSNTARFFILWNLLRKRTRSDPRTGLTPAGYSNHYGFERCQSGQVKCDPEARGHARACCSRRLLGEACS